MLPFSSPSIFNKNSSITSQHKIRAEWNINDFMSIEDYGCYTTTTNGLYNPVKTVNSTTYSYYKKNTGYDLGRSSIFFEGISKIVYCSGSASNLIVPKNHGITIGMRAVHFRLAAETYVVSITSGSSTDTIVLSRPITPDPTTQATTLPQNTQVSFYNYDIEFDKERINYTPLISTFDRNRPDPGIINLVANNKYGNAILSINKLLISNFGNSSGNTREDRLYPIYKNSNFRYWTSIRSILKNYIPETVGISSITQSNGTYPIEYAAPFIIYSEGFYTNKIVIKTQKYIGYPNSFKIDVLEGNNPTYGANTETEWKTIYTGSGTELSDGILEVYYHGGTSWDTTPEYLTEFIGTPSKAKKIHGVRFSVYGMSASRIPVDVIEIAPRLATDITDYVLDFSKVSTLSNTSYAIPIAGLVSTTGDVRISNIDRIFSSKNPDSILSNLLYEGTKLSFYQIVNSQEIPLGTLYAVSWAEDSDFTTRINLEDYMYFLKGIKSPDIAIANLTGIEASTAILILLDNAGITNYKFIKQSLTSKDDFVFEFFYSNNQTTLAETLENIAMSAQYAIFVDAENQINVVTKDKFSQLVSAESTDYWLVGSEDYTEPDPQVGNPNNRKNRAEFNYLNNNYISNLSTFNESSTFPVSDVTVKYTGNGILKTPKAIINAAKKFMEDQFNPSEITENQFLTTSLFSYSPTELWTIESSEGRNDATFLCAPYIQDISETMPTVLQNAKTIPIRGFDENSVVRNLYRQMNLDERKYVEIIFDFGSGTEFSQGGKFEGHILVNSELIKYRGIILDIFDEENTYNSATNKIVFNESEYNEIKANISPGSSIIAKGLLVDLNFSITDVVNALTSGDKEYLLTSDGRGANNTLIQKHTAETEPLMLNNIFVTKLYADNYNNNIKPTGQLYVNALKLNTPQLEKIYGGKPPRNFLGSLKISGPKHDFKADQDANLGNRSDESTKKELKKTPVDNFGERFISGFYQNLDFSPQRISTRMTLLFKQPKEYLVKEEQSQGENYKTSASDKNYFINRGIAGICFHLQKFSDGTTGYFLEVEEVGNITKDQLKDANFYNMRLYKVYKDSNGIYRTKNLGRAWVNQSATESKLIDIKNIDQDPKSWVETSDLIITIDQTPKNYIYRVYWEDQQVITAKEPRSKKQNENSNIIGLFVRSNSEAVFEHLMAAEVNKNGRYPVSTIFGKHSPYMPLQKAAQKSLLPPGFTTAIVGNQSVRVFYEDFGRVVREARKFNVTFSSPSIYSMPISLSRVNPAYNVANYSFSSYGAEFWVFNTSNSSINISQGTALPLSIAGVAINKLNPGEVKLSDYIKTRVGEDNEKALLLERNIKKYGSNAYTVSGEYINSMQQANSILSWILENSTKTKKTIAAQVFPNPLLELGDKVRIFYPELGYSYTQQGDKVYYIHSISYSVDNEGPKMSISVREI